MDQSNFGNSKGFQTQADYIEHVGDRFEMRGPQEILVAGVRDLPPSLGESWVAREALQARLRACLQQQPLTELVAAGGFGKSLLAAWAFRELKGSYNKRLWVNFRQQRWQHALSFDRFARGMLQEIGFPIKDPQASADDLSTELCYRLGDPNSTQKMLVVLDNVESLRQTEDWPLFQQFLHRWATQGQRSRVVVTTRPEAVTSHVMTIEGLTVAEGTAFLQQQALGGDRLEALVTLTAGHPLLLKLAATWVSSTTVASVNSQAIAFFRQLFEKMPDLAHSLSADTVEAAVALVFSEVFAALPPSLQQGLQQVSVYRIPFDLEMAQAMVAEISAENLKALAARALLVAEEGRFTLHPLIEALVQNQLSEASRMQAHEQALNYYQTHYQLWDSTIASCQEAFEVFHHNCELGRYAAAYKVIDYYYVVLERAGYWSELLPLYQQLTERWQMPSDETQSRSLVWAWIRLGTSLKGIGKYDETITASTKAGVIADTYQYLKGKSASLTNLGSAYSALGQYQQAIDFHQQSLAIEQDIDDYGNAAGSLCNLGHAYMALNDSEQAIDLYQRSLKIQRQVGYRAHESNSLGGLGSVYSSLGQYQQARDFHQQSLAIQQDIGDRRGIANSFNNLGSAYYSLGQYQQAIDFYQQSLAIQQDIGDRRGIANSFSGLGSAYYSLGQYQQAIDFHQQSLAIQQDIGDRRGIADSLGNLGNAYSSLGQYQQAIDFYQQSLAIQQDISDRRGIANSFNNLGSAYSSLGQYQQAIDFHQQSLAIKQDIGNRSGEALSHWNLNNCYQQHGRLRRAMYYRHHAYRLWHEIQLPLAAAPLTNLQKNLCQQLKDDWAQTLIESERKISWALLPLGYVIFAIRKLLLPFTALHKALKTRNPNRTKHRQRR